MVRVHVRTIKDEKIAKKNKLTLGKTYFVLRYRSKNLYFEHYPDRASLTNNSFLQHCYYLDDIREFFTAKTKKEFNENKAKFLEDIHFFIEDLQEKADKYPQNSNSNFVISKRIIALQDWYKSIEVIVPKWGEPLEKSLKKIHKTVLKLK